MTAGCDVLLTPLRALPAPGPGAGLLAPWAGCCVGCFGVLGVRVSRLTCTVSVGRTAGGAVSGDVAIDWRLLPAARGCCCCCLLAAADGGGGSDGEGDCKETTRMC